MMELSHDELVDDKPLPLLLGELPSLEGLEGSSPELSTLELPAPDSPEVSSETSGDVVSSSEVDISLCQACVATVEIERKTLPTLSEMKKEEFYLSEK